MKGYAPVPKIILDYPNDSKKPVSKRQALTELYLKVTYDEQMSKAGRLVRGQLFVTLKGLAKEWCWSKNKVRHFLAELERKSGEPWAIEQEIITPSTVDPMAKPRIIGRIITFKYYNEYCGELPK
ncbi:hypothetical protein ES707_06708 [subsurface metagenome]